MPLDPRAIIAGGENAKTEFKRDDRALRPERLAREIVAFANMNGGVIVIGVEDDGAISGVTRRNMQAWLMDTVIGRFIDPQIVPDYDEFVLDGKRIAVVTVPAGSAKPYAVRQQERTDYYIRLGDTVQRAGREQMARLFQSGGVGFRGEDAGAWKCVGRSRHAPVGRLLPERPGRGCGGGLAAHPAQSRPAGSRRVATGGAHLHPCRYRAVRARAAAPHAAGRDTAARVFRHRPGLRCQPG